MKKTLFIALIFLFSFCSKRESRYPRLIVEEANNVVQVNTKYMLSSNPCLFALNFTEDTKNNSTEIFKGFPKGFPNLTDDFCRNVSDTILPKRDLKIIIDTTYEFYSRGFVYKHCVYPKIDWKKYTDENCIESKRLSAYENKIKGLTNKCIEAYPLLIFNNSQTGASIGKNLTLIQEAKDKDGKWKPIEYFWSYGPGGGCIPLPNFLLQKKHYLATAIIKYHGDFKTKIRVKFQNQWNTFYSNEITACVNLSQFNKKPFIDNYKNKLNERSSGFEMSCDLAFLKYRKYRYGQVIIGM